MDVAVVSCTINICSLWFTTIVLRWWAQILPSSRATCVSPEADKSQHNQQVINILLCCTGILCDSWMPPSKYPLSHSEKYGQFSFIFSYHNQRLLPTLIHKSYLPSHIDQISHQTVRSVVIFLSWFPYYHFITSEFLQNHRLPFQTWLPLLP